MGPAPDTESATSSDTEQTTTPPTDSSDTSPVEPSPTLQSTTQSTSTTEISPGIPNPEEQDNEQGSGMMLPISTVAAAMGGVLLATAGVIITAACGLWYRSRQRKKSK